MYDKIKNEIGNDWYVDTFPNEGQRFVAWYLVNVLRRDKNQTRNEITDGANDKQIDALVIDDDVSSVFIIQGKFFGAGSIDAEPLREVLSAWVQLRDLKRLQEVSNPKLQRLIADLSKALEDEYEINFQLLTTSKLTDDAQKDLETFQKQLAELSEQDEVAASITLIDEEELEHRYNLALDEEYPTIDHTFTLQKDKALKMQIAGSQVLIAAVPLKECVDIPGILDGTLFQKNVRQSLGQNNVVNRGIRSTIYSPAHKDFFFLHNGITAICKSMAISEDSKLEVKGLSVVNGCQSLNTIHSCSETVKGFDDAFILFRFYEIPSRDRADRISICTNSQSAVKPRDLRSNDRRVLAFKRSYEQRYSTVNGYLETKRGEVAPATANAQYTLDLSDLAKFLISWQSQRPNVAYNENKIFDKYFEQLFKQAYKPENAFALKSWMDSIVSNWTEGNPLGLNPDILAMKAYAPYHQLYAVARCFAFANKQGERVPSPSSCWERVHASDSLETLIQATGSILNAALETAASRPQPQGRAFAPQNWIKSKTCLADINGAVSNYFAMMKSFLGAEKSQKFKDALFLDPTSFEDRWAADKDD